MPHTPFQNETLGALADCILEAAPTGHESRAEFLARCSARLHTLPLHRRALMGTALDLLGSGTATLLAGCPPRPFAQLTSTQQRRCCLAWTESALPPIRSAWQAIRRLVLTVHYAQPEVAGAVGYDGPFQARQQFRPFEGPLPDGPRRKGTDITTSGATPDGERHGVRGLYITDGSLLPTALGVNPQETIMAVAQLLASRIAARHRGVSQ